jgi:pSer/pThr/pTyr-binding forkhead associated (FHA) protein
MWLVSTGSVSGSLPFRLEPGQYVVGRTPGADIVIKDMTLSRRHALLVRTNQGLVVEDLDSLNGTFVDGERTNRAAAEIGGEIRFGAVICIVSPSALIPASLLDLESTFAARALASKTVEIEGLTPAQTEVLRHALRGLDEAAIAARLKRSVHTVHTHLKAIFRHFEVHSRPELIVKLAER